MNGIRETKEWNELKTKLYEIIKSISSNIIYDNIDIELKGGRKFNYDFELIYMVNNIIINKKFIEFKYNTCKIDKYPQFLSVSANKFIKSIDYAEYFYDNYINDICKLINIDVPNKTDYLKTVYNNDYNKLELFIELKEKNI
jgi:hypothetical protein